MGYINNFGDYVSDYLIILENNRGTQIEARITDKCDYMAVAKAERMYAPLYRAVKSTQLN